MCVGLDIWGSGSGLRAQGLGFLVQGLGLRVEAHNDGFSKCKGYVGIIGVPWGLTGSCKSHGFVCGTRNIGTVLMGIRM